MCELVKKEVHTDKPKAYSSLIDEPGYYCAKCGRAANNEDSLCKPKKLKHSKDG